MKQKKTKWLWCLIIVLMVFSRCDDGLFNENMSSSIRFVFGMQCSSQDENLMRISNAIKQIVYRLSKSSHLHSKKETWNEKMYRKLSCVSWKTVLQHTDRKATKLLFRLLRKIFNIRHNIYTCAFIKLEFMNREWSVCF